MIDTIKNLFRRVDNRDPLKLIRRMLLLKGLRFTFWNYIPTPHEDNRVRFIWGYFNNFVLWMVIFIWIGLPVPQFILYAAILAFVQKIVGIFLFILQLYRPIEESIKELPSFIQSNLSLYFYARFICWLAIAYVFDILVVMTGFSLLLGQQDIAATELWIMNLIENYFLRTPFIGISVIILSVALLIVNHFISIAKFMGLSERIWYSIIYPLTSFLPSLLIFYVGFSSLKNNFSLLAIILVIIGIRGILGTYIVLLSWLLISGFFATISMLFNLVQVRANVLALTTLAATIPFLNADSWQLVSQLKWSVLAGIIFLVYLLPILLLIVSKWEMIRKEIYLTGWKPRERLSYSKLLKESEALGLKLESIAESLGITTPVKPQRPTRMDFYTVMLKVVAKWIIFFVLTPAAVLILIFLFFNLIMSDDLLSKWLEQFASSPSVTFLGYEINPYTNIRIKAATFLALLSAGSTIVTLFNSKDELKTFINEEFVKDIWQDKQLLVVYRTVEFEMQTKESEGI